MSSSDPQRERFFTNRQSTTLLLALMAAVVLLPGVVWAAHSFTNVVIQDRDSHSQAEVTSTGALMVKGTVIAHQGNPATFRHYTVTARATETFGPNGCHVLVPKSPVGKSFELVTIHFNTRVTDEVLKDGNNAATQTFTLKEGTNCDGEDILTSVSTGLGNVSFPLHPGIGSSTGFSVDTYGYSWAEVTATGYLVPTSGVTR